jgi:hypothetical protein
MKTIAFWAIGFLALLAGCDKVTVEKPFGTPPAKIDPAEWVGYWHLDDDEVGRIKIVDAAAGLLEAAVVKDGPGGQQVERTKIYLREVGAWKFLFLPGEKASDGYTWVKYENYDGKMVMVWLPSTRRCKAALEQGLLRGEVRSEGDPAAKGTLLGETTSTTILLKELSPKEIELIMSEDKGPFFEWQHPLPFLRVRL